jgi:hypothetical protein
MLAAGRALGLAAVEVFLDPAIAARAKAEHAARSGGPNSCPIPETIGPGDVAQVDAERQFPDGPFIKEGEHEVFFDVATELFSSYWSGRASRTS